MQVTVARLDKTEVTLKEVELAEGATLEEAIRAAGWSVGANHKLAVWNVLRGPESKLQDGDRVEILPALTVDPMTARRLREEKNQKPENRLIHGRNGGKHRLI